MTNWYYIIVGYFSLFVFGFLDNTRGPYFPDITNDLSLTDTQASLFFAVASFLAVISGRMVPWWIEKIRLLNVMRMGLILLTVSVVGYSKSTSLIELIVYTSFFGYGFGLINVGQNLLIIRGSGDHNRRQLISGLHSTYAMAALIAPLVVGFLTDFGWTWRDGFYSFAALSFLGFLISFIAKTKEGSPVKLDSADIFGWRKWLPFGLVLSLYVASEVVLATRYVLLARREFGASESEAVLQLAGLFALLLVGRLSFTFFPFKKWSNKIIILSALVLSLTSFTLGLAVSHWFLILCGLTMAPVFGIGVEYMATQFGKDTDRVISMVLAFSGLFIVAIHWTVGVLSDIFGIGNAMYAGPFMILVATVIMWTLPSDRGNKVA